MRFLLVILFFAISCGSAISDERCRVGQSTFFNSHCVFFEDFQWGSLDDYEVTTEVLGLESSYIDCRHLRQLQNQYNEALQYLDLGLDGNVELDSSFTLATVRRFKSFSLERFFDRSQLLIVSFTVPRQLPNNSRVVFIFNGSSVEKELGFYLVDDGAGTHKIVIQTNSGELCFSNDFSLIIYDDVRDVNSFYLYKSINPLISFKIPYATLQGHLARAHLYRSRVTDNKE